jgi:hypothetical protein
MSSPSAHLFASPSFALVRSTRRTSNDGANTESLTFIAYKFFLGRIGRCPPCLVAPSWPNRAREENGAGRVQ